MGFKKILLTSLVLVFSVAFASAQDNTVTYQGEYQADGMLPKKITSLRMLLILMQNSHVLKDGL